MSKASVIHDGDMMGSGEMEELVMLTTPVNLQANAMSTSVLITWDMVEGATGYQVSVKGLISFEFTAAVQVPSIYFLSPASSVNFALTVDLETFSLRLAKPSGSSS